MTLWVTSDIHFGHTNIIKYCNRPFSSVEEMNEGIIENWNEVVLRTDNVFILGDVAMGTLTQNVPLLGRLKGNKILIVGNHDAVNPLHNKSIEYSKLYGEHFISMHYQHVLPRFADNRVIMSHYPLVYDAGWSFYNLHGHIHGKNKWSGPRSIDVGMDAWNYRPASEDEIKELINDKL